MLENAQDILIFIFFLGPLVFFHELGHYLFARLFGVRVEVFSLGFGPKILKFKRGDTQYAVSLIPLGGYVKMYGDDPFNKDAVPEEERKYSFTHQSKWARFWIVLGGPLANFLMAYVIFFGLLMSGEKVPEMRTGVLPQKSILYSKGFRTNDLLLKVNDKSVLNPSDVILDGGKKIENVSIERNGETLTLPLSMTGENFFKEWVKYPPPRQPLIANRSGKIFALSADKTKVNWDMSLNVMGDLDLKKVFYLFPIDKLGTVSQMEKNLVNRQGVAIQFAFENQKEFMNDLFKKGFQPLDMVIEDVTMNSAADKAGLRARDVITTLGSKRISDFDDLRNSLQKTTTEVVSIKIWREGVEKEFQVRPEITKHGDKEIKLIGVKSSIAFVERKLIHMESQGFMASSIKAVERTWSTMVKTMEGFKKLITGAVPFKEVGGPFAIGSVASNSFHTSISYFFQMMALISINLGLINLFPIPVLDGGHILFIALEILNRGPVSRRKMEIAQQIGLSLLLMLMAGALFNDFQRFIP